LDHADVVVIGAGVVGSATTLALARRGLSVIALEAGPEPGLEASGSNSGILHTGFDSPPGELETQLILRSAALRQPLLAALGVPIVHCGALVRPLDDGGRERLAALAANAGANGVEVVVGGDEELEVPGEGVTDPAAFTLSLSRAARRHGAEVRTRTRVIGVEERDGSLAVTSENGYRVRCRVAVNCAGLHADEVARMVGDGSFEIFPRKGEFLVLEPAEGTTLDRILLPTPTERTKGVLVFPTVDGKVVAGPTAVDQRDKSDWSVRRGARAEILPRATAMWEPLEWAKPVTGYAGLRPAGRGVNYLIGPSRACRSLINVAAIRSTGLTASLGIAERVCEIAASLGLELGEEQPLRADPPPLAERPWWRRAAERSAR
jgi:glycerol-3-phosphate dehydrogenase